MVTAIAKARSGCPRGSFDGRARRMGAVAAGPAATGSPAGPSPTAQGVRDDRDPRPAAAAGAAPGAAPCDSGRGLAGAVVLAIGVSAVLGGGAPAYAAYAVTDNPDGTITIKIYEAKDAKGLQATLRSRGFNVIVDYVPADKTCAPQPRSTTWVPGVRLARPQTVTEEGEGAGFRIDPSVVKPGQTVVLEFLVKEGDGGIQAGISDRVSAGPVADCVLVDRPEGPRDPS